jgi:hypothetical protein
MRTSGGRARSRRQSVAPAALPGPAASRSAVRVCHAPPTPTRPGGRQFFSRPQAWGRCVRSSARTPNSLSPAPSPAAPRVVHRLRLAFNKCARLSTRLSTGLWAHALTGPGRPCNRALRTRPPGRRGFSLCKGKAEREPESDRGSRAVVQLVCLPAGRAGRPSPRSHPHPGPRRGLRLGPSTPAAPDQRRSVASGVGTAARQHRPAPSTSGRIAPVSTPGGTVKAPRMVLQAQQRRHKPGITRHSVAAGACSPGAWLPRDTIARGQAT